jgi:hypothetical protein
MLPAQVLLLPLLSVVVVVVMVRRCPPRTEL